MSAQPGSEQPTEEDVPTNFWIEHSDGNGTDTEDVINSNISNNTTDSDAGQLDNEAGMNQPVEHQQDEDDAGAVLFSSFFLSVFV